MTTEKSIAVKAEILNMETRQRGIFKKTTKYFIRFRIETIEPPFSFYVLPVTFEQYNTHKVGDLMELKLSDGRYSL
jgi:hypothetical protein